MNVLYFAAAKDTTGVACDQFHLPQALTLSEFIQNRLLVKHPKLSSILPQCLISVNLDVLERDSVRELQDGDELALIPPVSGG